MTEVETLMTAAKTGDLQMLRGILSQKSGWVARFFGLTMTVRTEDGDREQPLHHAARGGHMAIASFLLDSGAPIEAKNKWGRTPLHNAAQAGQTQLASLLLDRGALVGAKDYDGSTPLHKAAGSGHLLTVRLLLERGADPTAGDKHGRPPLEEALSSGHVDIADALFLASGKSGLRGGKDSPLFHETVLWHAESVRWLIRNGADPNVRNRQGMTPLHIVAQFGYLATLVSDRKNPAETLCVLLEGGADVYAKDVSGKTPLDTIREEPSKLNSLREAFGAMGMLSGRTSNLQQAAFFIQQMHSILETHAGSPTSQKFASEALERATQLRVPFCLISPIVRAVMDALRARYPGSSISDIVQQSNEAFEFACPRCGPLNKELVKLAVSATWVQEMNPSLVPTFAGPNVASVFGGWCPGCLGVSVRVRFDPAKLRLGC